MTLLNPNANLGTEVEMDELVARVRALTSSTVAPTQQMAIAKALAIIAADVVKRHDEVRAMQLELAEKIEIASVAGELAGVLGALSPRKVTLAAAPARRWFASAR